jgi:hypothetical protein
MNATQRTAVPLEAVNSLTACLRSQPTQDAWIDALSAVLDCHWPAILQMPRKEHEAALAEFLSTVEAARATAQLTRSSNCWMPRSPSRWAHRRRRNCGTSTPVCSSVTTKRRSASACSTHRASRFL